MGFDRSKFKTTTASSLQKKEAELSVKRPSSGRNEFIKLEEGDTTLRIMPYHPEGGGELFAEAKCVSWLEVSVPKRDDNGQIIEGETEIKKKGIFNSKVHGDLPDDLVEAYLKVAKEKAIPDVAGTDKNVFFNIWKKLVGDKDKKPQKGDKYSPIRPTDSSVAYAMKSQGRDDEGNHIWGDISEWEIKKSIKDAMIERAAEYESPDPFTDIDNGIAVIVTYNSKATKPADYYKVKLETKKKGNAMEYIPSPLSEAQIEKFLTLKPLYKKYVNVFKRSDLDLQIDGLKRLDDKLAKDHPGFSVFQYDEFLDLIEALYELVPEGNHEQEGEEREEEVKQEEKPVAKKIEKPSVAIKKEEPKKEIKKVVHEEELAVPSGTSGEDRMAAIRARLGKK